MKIKVLSIVFIFTIFFSNLLFADSNANNMQQWIFYGEWQDLMPAGTPTQYKNYFYDENNRLVGTVRMNPMASDSESTIEIEEKGQLLPDEMQYYIYNDKGDLIEIKESRLSIHDGLYRSWTNWNTIESFVYNDKNQIIIHNEGLNSTKFEYEGNNVIKKESFNKNQWSETCLYKNFIEGKDNLPQTALITSKYSYQCQLAEYKYDEMGNITEYCSFALKETSIEKDDNGIIIKADKDENKGINRSTYEYESGKLIRQTSYYWNNSSKNWSAQQKTEYTNNVNSIKEQSFSYSSNSEKWSKTGTPVLKNSFDYDKLTAAKNPKVIYDEKNHNSFKVVADIAEKKVENAKWFILCNGEVKGEAKIIDNKLEYSFNNVRNGEYIFFFQQIEDNANAYIGHNISTPIEVNLNTELSAPKNIKIEILADTTIGSGINMTKYNQANITWEKPDNSLNVLGYNIYTDLKYTSKNPNPVNFDNTNNAIVYELIKDNNYRMKWEYDKEKFAHTIYVEAVYEIGNKKSLPTAVVFGNEAKEDTEIVYILNDKGEKIAEEHYNYTFDNNLAYISRFKISEGGKLVPETYTTLHYGGRKMKLDSISRYNADPYGVYTEWGDRELLWSSKDKTPYTDVIKVTEKNEVVKNNFYAESAPSKLTIKQVNDSTNDYNITCYAGMLNFGAKEYNVYRNGIIIGTAKPMGTRIMYIDKNVPNGEWFYNVKANTECLNCAINTSNTGSIVVNNVRELAKVTEIEEVKNGYEGEDYILSIKWNKPESEYEVKGYNVYTDSTNAALTKVPFNGLNIIDTEEFSFNCQNDTVQKSVCIETLYSEGKIKSDDKVFIITKRVDVDAATQKQVVLIQNMNEIEIVAEDNVLKSTIYNLNGMLIKSSNEKIINISDLNNGVYIINIQFNGYSECIKFVKL